jgi:hypothetical protein
MKLFSKWSARAISVAAVTAAITLMFGGVASADNIQDTITDTGTGVTLVAGSDTAGTAAIRVIGNNADGTTGPTPDPGCNWDTGEDPLVLKVITPEGVTALPDPVSIKACGVDVSLTFKASASAVSGNVTVSIVSSPAGGGGYNNQVLIPITVLSPPNTKPSVAVSGVTDGASYEIGSVPAATCDVTDTEDGNSTKDAVVTGTLSHGLGSQTATCDYTDEGGLEADTKTATYTIVDTGDPTIKYELDPSAANGNGWYNQDVNVDFICDDSGSGIQSCAGDTTLTEGADQSATGTATDWAGNTATSTASGIDIDKTAPQVDLVGGPTGDYYFGNDPAAPTCEATDALSGIASCVISGGGSSVGEHSYTATATDKAGNEAAATLNYTVLAWTTKGFYSPVDMGGVVNTVKGGSTVPLKFELFAGTTEKTTVDAIKSFTTTKVNCLSGAEADEIEILSTGGTSLRYDTTGGQFIQNWKTPTGAGCYTVKMTSADGSIITAHFKTR